jgi:chromosome segregation ATPase
MEYASELESEKYAKKTLQEAVNKQSVEMLELSRQLQRLQQELEERKTEGEQRERHKTEGNTVAEEMFSGSGQETIDGRSTEDDEMMKQTLRNLEMERNTLATQLQAALTEREDLGHQLLQLSSEKDALTQQLQSVAGSEKEIGDESHDSHVIQDMYQELLTNFSALQVGACADKVSFIAFPYVVCF